jgi:hypothetical protein
VTDTAIKTTPTKTYTWLDPSGLAKTVVLWLYIDTATTGLNIATTGLDLATLQRFSPNTAYAASDILPGMEPVTYIVMASSILQVISAIVTGVLMLKWIYRSSRNAHALASGLTITPPWSVGWFFIPFANLVKPYEGVKQAWRASMDADQRRVTAESPVLKWWWGLWLTSNILANLDFRFGTKYTTVSGAILSDMLTLVALAVSIAANLAAIRVVKQLSAMQVEAIQRKTFA